MDSKKKFQSCNEANGQNPYRLEVNHIVPLSNLSNPFPIHVWCIFNGVFYLINSSPPKTNTPKYVVNLIKNRFIPSSAKRNTTTSQPSF